MKLNSGGGGDKAHNVHIKSAITNLWMPESQNENKHSPKNSSRYPERYTSDPPFFVKKKKKKSRGPDFQRGGGGGGGMVRAHNNNDYLVLGIDDGICIMLDGVFITFGASGHSLLARCKA